MNKKILYISYNAPFGKKEIFVTRNAIRLAKSGYEIKMLTLFGDREIENKIEYEEIKKNVISQPLICFRNMINGMFISLKNFKKLKKLLKIAISDNGLKKIINNIFSIFIAFAAHKRYKDIKLIFVHWGTAPSTIALFLSKINNTKVILKTHRWDIYQDNLLSEKVRCFEKVIAISEKSKKDICSLIKNDECEQKIKVVINSIELNNENFYELNRSVGKEIKLVCAGNLEAVKGHIFLLDAISQIVTEGDINVEVDIYGSGLLQREIKNYIDANNLNNNVTLFGHVSRARIIDKYKQGYYDIFVHPSIVTTDGEFEGVPNAVLEAMAYGIPIIATNTGSINEIFKELPHYEFLIEEKSSEKLKQAIYKLSTSEERQKISKLMYKNSQNFDVSNNLKKHKDIIDECICMP